MNSHPISLGENKTNKLVKRVDVYLSSVFSEIMTKLLHIQNTNI